METLQTLVESNTPVKEILEAVSNKKYEIWFKSSFGAISKNTVNSFLSPIKAEEVFPRSTTKNPVIVYVTSPFDSKNIRAAASVFMQKYDYLTIEVVPKSQF